MYYGINIPQFGPYGDAAVLAELAREAEEAGWDGFFIWDHVLFDPDWHPMVDPWVALTAMALNTTRIRIGTMVTPLPRRRPWKLARETVSVERLSQGRLTLGVGIGDPVRWEFGFFHEESDTRIRAAKLDEGLEVLTNLWTGKPFSYQGTYYQLEEMIFQPTPLQSPRIPIWVAGWWPNKPPMRRAARWDGVVPGGRDRPLTPEDWVELIAYIQQFRQQSTPFDYVHSGATSGTDSAGDTALVKEYAAVGVTWWLESLDPWRFGLPPETRGPWPIEAMNQRIRQGPPSPSHG